MKATDYIKPKRVPEAPNWALDGNMNDRYWTQCAGIIYVFNGNDQGGNLYIYDVKDRQIRKRAWYTRFMGSTEDKPNIKQRHAHKTAIEHFRNPERTEPVVEGLFLYKIGKESYYTYLGYFCYPRDPETQPIKIKPEHLDFVGTDKFPIDYYLMELLL